MNAMTWHGVIRPILADDRWTRGLGDPEARLLVEWLVHHAESLQGETDAAVRGDLARLHLRARSIARFVELWCYRGLPGAAGQLALSEGFSWPLPPLDVDPYFLIHDILAWEDDPGVDEEDARFFAA